MNLSTDLRWELISDLYFNLGFTDNFDSSPVGATPKNDYAFTTSVGQLCPKLCPKLKGSVLVGRRSTSLTLQTHIGPAIFILARPTKNAQDLKSCEGFPREGSSPYPGTIESTGYENSVSPENPKIGFL